MIIKTDPEGKKLLENLCDVALRAGGIKNLQEVGRLLQSIELIKKKKDGPK